MHHKHSLFLSPFVPDVFIIKLWKYLLTTIKTSYYDTEKKDIEIALIENEGKIRFGWQLKLMIFDGVFGAQTWVK